jgi:hypothetical protein
MGAFQIADSSLNGFSPWLALSQTHSDPPTTVNGIQSDSLERTQGNDARIKPLVLKQQ